MSGFGSFASVNTERCCSPALSRLSFAPRTTSASRRARSPSAAARAIKFLLVVRSYEDDDEGVAVMAVDLLDKQLGCFGVSATRAASGDWSCCVGVASVEEDAVGDVARFFWRGTSAGRVTGGILSSGSVSRVFLLAVRSSERSVIIMGSKWGRERSESAPRIELDWVDIPRHA